MDLITRRHFNRRAAAERQPQNNYHDVYETLAHAIESALAEGIAAVQRRKRLCGKFGSY
jgi:hypothetical protein